MTQYKINKNGGLHDVEGFSFAGIAIDDSPKKNLGLIYAEKPSTIGTAVYTKNDVKAASVVISQQHDKNSEIKRAILINSGTANAFTGQKGHQAALDCVKTISTALCIDLPEIYIGSTGTIGTHLPLDAIKEGINNLATQKMASSSSASDFTQAIMTTDTRRKQASITYEDNGCKITIGGCVKGAGMIMPNMATMLATILCNINISKEMLHCALDDAVSQTFNCATIDGDTSTNDSVFILANGSTETSMITCQNTSYRLFLLHLTLLCEHLTKEMIRDGEGITKFITIRINGVPEKESGRKVAMSIANSPLVKTALFGSQLNWGRILMAAGKAYSGLDFNLLDISINSIPIIIQSQPMDKQTLEIAEEAVKSHDIDIDLHFNQGNQCVTIWTSDFSYDYVKINSNYLT